MVRCEVSCSVALGYQKTLELLLDRQTTVPESAAGSEGCLVLVLIDEEGVKHRG